MGQTYFVFSALGPQMATDKSDIKNCFSDTEGKCLLPVDTLSEMPSSKVGGLGIFSMNKDFSLAADEKVTSRSQGCLHW